MKDTIINMTDNLEETYSVGSLIKVLQQLDPKLPIVINDEDQIVMITKDKHPINGDYYSFISKPHIEDMVDKINEMHGIKENDYEA